MDESCRLFIIMTDPVHPYCLYEILAPDNDDTSFCNLGAPLLEMEADTFPDGMSFVGLGSKIYMIGGVDPDGEGRPCAQTKTFIFDTKTRDLKEGPSLISGKSNPYLLIVGAKIYALSSLIDSFKSESSLMDPHPQFEMLDTNNIDKGWVAFPFPSFKTVCNRKTCVVEACVAASVAGGGSFIYVSLREAGTFSFNCEKGLWNYCGSQMLPFQGDAITIPPSSNGSSVYFVDGTGSLDYFGFRVRSSPERGGSIYVSNADLVEFDTSELNTEVPPCLFSVSTLIVYGSSCHGFDITSGCDNPDGRYHLYGNRYVKVSGFCLRQVKMKTLEGNEKEITKMTRLWTKCINGGPMFNPLEQVVAAIAMSPEIEDIRFGEPDSFVDSLCRSCLPVDPDGPISISTNRVDKRGKRRRSRVNKRSRKSVCSSSRG